MAMRISNVPTDECGKYVSVKNATCICKIYLYSAHVHDASCMYCSKLHR